MIIYSKLYPFLIGSPHFSDTSLDTLTLIRFLIAKTSEMKNIRPVVLIPRRRVWFVELVFETKSNTAESAIANEITRDKEWNATNDLCSVLSEIIYLPTVLTSPMCIWVGEKFIEMEPSARCRCNKADEILCEFREGSNKTYVGREFHEFGGQYLELDWKLRCSYAL